MAEVFPAERLRGRFAGVDLDELVDWRVVRTWLYLGHVLAHAHAIGRRGDLGSLQLIPTISALTISG